MLVGLVVLTLIDPPLVTVCSLVRNSYLRPQKASLLFLDLMLKLNIGLLLMLWMNFHAFILYCLSLTINCYLWLWFLLFFLHIIQFRTCALNMLKLTLTLCMKSGCQDYSSSSCYFIPSICRYHDKGFTKYLVLWILLQCEHAVPSYSNCAFALRVVSVYILVCLILVIHLYANIWSLIYLDNNIWPSVCIKKT